MDWSRDFVLIVMFSLGLQILIWIRHIRHAAMRPWLAKGILLMSTLGLCLWKAPRLAPWIAGIGWGLLVLLPILVFRWVQATGAANPQRAQRVTSIVRWLHPFAPWWTMPLIWKAYALQGQGRVEEAIEIWSQVPEMKEEAETFGEMLRMRQAMQWDELAETLWEEAKQSEDMTFSVKLAYLLRSLGESGRFAEMEEAALRYESALPALGEQVILFLLAFFGQREALEETLQGVRSLSPATQAYWRAVSMATQGQYDEARAILEKALAYKDVEPLVKNQIQWRLEHLEALAPYEISPALRRLLLTQHRAYSERHKLNIFASPEKQKRPWVTYAVASGLIVVYLMQAGILPSPLRGMAMLRWGAFSPPLFWGGEYWRLFTSNVLHADAVHLSVNLFSLLLFGPFAEGWLGRIRFFVLVFFAGIIANCLLLAGTALGWMPRYYLLVGASSAIMGILGAAAAILWRVHSRIGSSLARRNFFFLLSLLLLQAVFDYFSPHTSGAAHITGAFAGLCLSLLLFPKSRLQSLPAVPETPMTESAAPSEDIPTNESTTPTESVPASESNPTEVVTEDAVRTEESRTTEEKPSTPPEGSPPSS
ncbi:MAG: rhomboid family intramembrane serine protease [Myxococcales bacterium]|nr:rhomboid family intramembrane serine protease [Myxococcales bacterium]